MTYHVNIRSAALIGRISNLQPFQVSAVLYPRLWCNGPEAQAQVWHGFAERLDPAAGREAVRALEYLSSRCARQGWQVLMRRQPTGKCPGADEAYIARALSPARGSSASGTCVRALLCPWQFHAPWRIRQPRDVGGCVQERSEFSLGLLASGIGPHYKSYAHGITSSTLLRKKTGWKRRLRGSRPKRLPELYPIDFKNWEVRITPDTDA